MNSNKEVKTTTREHRYSIIEIRKQELLLRTWAMLATHERRAKIWPASRCQRCYALWVFKKRSEYLVVNFRLSVCSFSWLACRHLGFIGILGAYFCNLRRGLDKCEIASFSCFHAVLTISLLSHCYNIYSTSLFVCRKSKRILRFAYLNNWPGKFYSAITDRNEVFSLVRPSVYKPTSSSFNLGKLWK